MAIMVASVVVAHAVAFAGVLLLAKYSVMRVDEDGHLADAPSPWHERIVASCQAPASLEA